MDQERCPLTGKRGNPIRIFTSDGKPVTDKSGYPLYNINDVQLFSYDHKLKKFEDIRGMPLFDADGIKSTEYSFDPEREPTYEHELPPILDNLGRPKQLYDINGHPLTDSMGRPLTNSSGLLLMILDPRGDPMLTLDGKIIINKCGIPVTDKRKLKQESERREPYRLFDVYMKPLTDVNGYPLTDIRGESLLVLDDSNTPCGTTYGSDIYDAQGIKRNSSGYDPTKPPPQGSTKEPFKDCRKREILVFDRKGCPLTSLDAVPLSNSLGRIMIKWENKLLVDSAGDSVIKVFKAVYGVGKFQRVQDAQGNPARLFDVYGKPLTSSEGEPLTNADGIFLLMFDLQGYPEADWNGGPLYDERRLTMGRKNFNPCAKLTSRSQMKPVVEWVAQRCTLYDASGMPVTDRGGISLFTARGIPMVTVNKNNIPISDYRGRPLFDSNSLPLMRSLERPILGPCGTPARLFDEFGTPLTDRHGYCLKCVNGEFMIRTDSIGKITRTYKGGNIYDSLSLPMTCILDFNPYRTPRCEGNTLPIALVGQRPIPLYNFNGYPLTDNSGRALVDWNGHPLVSVNSTENELTDRQGNPVYDIKGSLYYFKEQNVTEKLLIYDCNGRPLTDSCGNILKSRLGISLITVNEQGKPTSDLFLGKLFDWKGRELSEHNISQNKLKNTNKIKVVFGGKLQLFDCSDLPLLDSSGAVLYTSSGKPLLNLDKGGRPISDIHGGPVFDENAIPVIKADGAWTDRVGNPLRLFDEEKFPLTDELGMELTDIWNNSVIHLDEFSRPLRDKHGRPVFDAAGISITSYRFNGALKPRLKSSLESIKLYTKYTHCPTRLYDSDGRPLTDGRGKPLLNSDGDLLVHLLQQRWIEDLNGGRVYDKRKLPLACRMGAPIISITGKPVRLYDKEGHPLTGLDGFPLRLANDKPMIVFDNFGMPLEDSQGKTIYDSKGRPLNNPLFDPEGDLELEAICLVDKHNVPVKTFDKNGKPLTDCKGRLLYNRERCRLINKKGGHFNGKSNVFDEFGNIALLRINMRSVNLHPNAQQSC